MRFAFACLAASSVFADTAHELWMKHIQEAKVFWRAGAVAEARLSFEKALVPAAELAANGDNLVIPATHSHLADLHAVTGRLDRCEWHALEGLRMLEPLTGVKKLPVEGKLRMSLGIALYRTGREPAGESEFLRAVTLYRQAKGVDTSELALAIINVATVRLEQKRLGEAENLMLEVLDMHKAMPGRKTASLALAHEGIGVLRVQEGKFAEGEGELRQAIEILTALYGPMALEMAHILEIRARALTKLKRKKEAKELTRHAEAIRKSMGPNWQASSVSVHTLRSGK